jgi:hypothetical protein
MTPTLAELLRDWRDFFMLVGAASATLVGLMFVAASIGSNIFSEEHRGPMGAFLTPTVVHFATLLFLCLLAIMPIYSWLVLGGALAAGGLAGLIYCGRILVEMVVRRRFKVDLSDRLFYSLLPTLGYLLLLGSAGLLFAQSAASVDVIAAAILVLLLAALRNAWDMTVWIAINSPSGPPRPKPKPEDPDASPVAADGAPQFRRRDLP